MQLYRVSLVLPLLLGLARKKMNSVYTSVHMRPFHIYIYIEVCVYIYANSCQYFTVRVL